MRQQELLISAGAELKKIAPLSEQEIAQILAGTETRHLETNEILIHQGAVDLRVGILISGTMSVEFVDRCNRLFIRKLIAPGNLFGSCRSLVAQEPSWMRIRALEPSSVTLTCYNKIRSLSETRPGLMELRSRFFESLSLDHERREYELLTMSPEQRLAAFLEKFGHLSSKIKEKELAGYLGISPESLSRMRARILQRRKLGLMS